MYERFTDALFLWYYTNYLGQSVGYSLLQVSENPHFVLKRVHN